MSIFKYFCHRIPERSFFIGSHQFPVCARCTGAYLGIAIMILVYFSIPMPFNLDMIFLSFILAIPAVVDGVTQLFNFRVSNNGLRVITGFLLGVAIVIFFKSLKHIFLL